MTGFADPALPVPDGRVAECGRSPQTGTAPLCASLRELGVTSLGAVLFTHLHPEQLAGLIDFGDAALCLIGRAERPSGRLRFLYSDPLDSVASVQEFNFEMAQDMPPLGPCIDILGDGSLWAISTAGHTVGAVSYLAMDVNGPMLVAGLLAGGLRGHEPTLGSHGRHKELGLFSLRRLRDFLELYPSVRLAPMLHDAATAAPSAGIAEVPAIEDEVVGGRFE